MSVRRRTIQDRETGLMKEVWVVDIDFTHPDGRRERIRKHSPVNTRRGAEQYEREVRNALLKGEYKKKKEEIPETQPIPTFKAFSIEFVNTYAKMNNKPSEIHNKERMLRTHLNPYFGSRPLDSITTRDIETYKAKKIESGLSPKSVNNHLAVAGRMFRIAKKWEVIGKTPEVSFLKVKLPDYDFLDFREAERLIAGADPEWRAMIVVALRTGMRLGELRALRWQDVDLVAGKLFVRQAAWNDVIGTPKSGRPREIPLSNDARQSLKAHRHLRGEYVFAGKSGDMLHKAETKWPLRRAWRKAGLREVGWHMLRHTFASHLAMKGVPLKAIQELLGHADIHMTMRYAHMSPDTKRDAVQLLDEPQVRPEESYGTLTAHDGSSRAAALKSAINTDS
ncbi:MAG: site-specific integrase [Deltaproteobacteria bacterium]|nr:site-specific integrase [Deltaproteobacteria bacterium]